MDSPLKREDIHFLATVLSSSSQANMNKEMIFGALHLDFSDLPDLNKRYYLNNCNSYSFMTDMLLKWIEQEGPVPTLVTLESALRSISLIGTAETLKSKWEQRPGTSSLPSKRKASNTIWFDMKEPVHSFTGRQIYLEQIFESLTRTNTQNFTVISAVSGLGGIGKTELARKFAYEYADKFDNNVIWIRAESREQLDNSFSALVTEELGMPSRGERQIHRLVKDAYNFFRDQKVLFIFDNAESFKIGSNGIVDYLPYSLPPNTSRPYILVTSRSSAWGLKNEVITLHEMTREEAVQLLKDCLELNTDPEIEAACQLADLLGYLPLALQQAIAYIKCSIRKNNPQLDGVTSSELAVLGYIHKFNTESINLLSYDDPYEFGDLFEKTVFFTWKITLDKIGETNSKAIKLMTALAYMRPDQIYPETFLRNEFMKMDELKDAILILSQYNMIAQDSMGGLNVHRLVQHVVRLNNAANEEIVLKELLQICSEYLKELIEFSEYNSTHEVLLGHFQQCLKLTLKHKVLVKEYREMAWLLAQNCDNRGLYAMALDVLENTTRITDEIMPELDDTNIQMKSRIGSILISQQKSEQARIFLENVHSQVEKVKGEDNPLTLRLLGNLGRVFVDLGKFPEALEIFEKLIVIQMKSESGGPLHEITIVAVVNKASTLNHMARYEEAMECLKSSYDAQILEEPPNEKLILYTQYEISRTLRKQKKFEEALVICKEVFENRKRIYGETNYFTLATVACLVRCLLDLNKIDEAMDIAKSTAKMAEQNRDNYPWYLLMKFLMAKCHRSLNNHKDAIALLNETLELMEDLYGEFYPEVAETRYKLGSILETQDSMLEEALEHFKAAFKIRSQISGLQHPYTVEAENCISRIETKLNSRESGR